MFPDSNLQNLVWFKSKQIKKGSSPAECTPWLAELTANADVVSPVWDGVLALWEIKDLISNLFYYWKLTKNCKKPILGTRTTMKQGWCIDFRWCSCTRVISYANLLSAQLTELIYSLTTSCIVFCPIFSF